MVKFDVEGSQNVEVSKKIPCEKPQAAGDYGNLHGGT